MSCALPPIFTTPNVEQVTPAFKLVVDQLRVQFLEHDANGANGANPFHVRWRAGARDKMRNMLGTVVDQTWADETVDRMDRAIAEHNAQNPGNSAILFLI